VPGPRFHLRSKPFVSGQTVELGVEHVELGGSPVEVSRSAVNVYGALPCGNGLLAARDATAWASSSDSALTLAALSFPVLA
jgi:hypothetical protein